MNELISRLRDATDDGSRDLRIEAANKIEELSGKKAAQTIKFLQDELRDLKAATTARALFDLSSELSYANMVSSNQAQRIKDLTTRVGELLATNRTLTEDK